MLFANVLVPLTVRFEKLILFVILGLVPLISSEPTVKLVCKSTVALKAPPVALIVNRLAVLPSVPDPLSAKVPALTLVEPPKLFKPESVSVPTPALLKLTPLPAMIPVMEPAPLLVIKIEELLASVMAAALSVPVVTDRPLSGVSPTTLVNAVLPVVSVVSTNAPDTVEPKFKVPAELPVSVVFATSVTAPV